MRAISYSRALALVICCVVTLCVSACGGSDDSAPSAPPATPPPPTTPPPPAQPPATTTINGPDGAAIVIPDGAFDAPTTVRIAKDSSGATALPALFVPAGDVFSITPHNTALRTTALVRIPIDSATPADARLALAQAEPGGTWRFNTRARRNGAVLEIEVDRLSLFRVVRFATGADMAAPALARKQTARFSGIRMSATDFAVNGDFFENNVPYTAPTLVPITAEAYGGVFFANGLCPIAQAIYVTQYNSAYRVPPSFFFARSVGVQKISIDPARGGPWSFDLRVYRPFTSSNPEMIADVEIECRDVYGTVYGISTDEQVRYLVSNPSAVGFFSTPADRAVAVGQPASFDVRVVGGPESPTDRDQYRLVWERSDDAGAVWRSIGTSYQSEVEGSLSARDGRLHVITLSNVAAADNGALIRARACYAPPGSVEQCVNSASGRLTVAQDVVPPTITQQPRSMATLVGETANFTVAVAGTPAPTIQWQVLTGDVSTWLDVGGAGTTWPGATPNAPMLVTLPATLSRNGWLFRVVVTNTAGSVTSEPAIWRITERAVAPTITVQPAPASVLFGATALFAAVADGTAPLSYQWQRDGIAIPGANSPVLSIANVQAEQLGTYRIAVSNSAGSVQSNGATLTIGGGPLPPTAPMITTNPSPRTVMLGQPAAFDAAVSGAPTPTCQWTRNGVAIVGATSCTNYTTPAATSLDNGAVFNIVAYNAGGAAFGGGAVLTVQGVAPPAGAWQVQATGVGNTLFDIALVGGSPDTVVAVGYSATIVRSTDGGATWTRIAAPMDDANFLLQVKFFDAQVGIALGLRDILRTSDGGFTWQSVWTWRQDEASVGRQELFGFDWIDVNTLVAVGPQRVYRSLDGGRSWQLHGSAEPYGNDVAFFGQVGLATRDYRVMRTTDGGLTWNEVGAGVFVDPQLRVAHVSGNDWVVVGGRGTYHSVDNGINWFRTDQPTKYLLGVRVHGSQVIATGETGSILRSQDGGQTWSEGPDVGFGQLWGVDFVAGGRAFVAGAGGLVARRD